MAARNLRWVGGMGRIARMATLGGVAFLIAFHGWLFAGRLLDGELLEPAVALRWMASVFLVAALLGLRRAGVPLVRGRRALVFWVSVLLLHWSATPMAERSLATGELLIAAPGAVALATGAVLLLGAARRRRRAHRPPRLAGPAAVPPHVPAARWLPLALAARPPPR